MGSCLQGVELGRDYPGMGAMDTDTDIKEVIKDENKEEEKKDSDEIKEEVIEDKKKQKNEPNMFVKVKERFSTRSKKKNKLLKDTVSNEEIINDKDMGVTQEHSKLDSEETSNKNNAKMNKNEATNEQDEEDNEDLRAEKEKENKDDENTNKEQAVKEKKKKKSESNVFIRVEERLSKRSE